MGLTASRVIAEASEYLIAITNQDPWPKAPMPRDLVFRWGCTSTIPCRNVVNTAKAIHLVNDKAMFRWRCQEHTEEVVPKTWFYSNQFLGEGEFPCIVRPENHFQGRHLYFCNDVDDLQKACRELESGYYISEYILKVAEYRVFVVQGRIAFMYEKVPVDPTAIAWNHAQGASVDNVKWGQWPRDVCEKALTVFNLSGLDFGAVDVIVDEDGRAYVLEINTAPAIESPYRASCTAKCFDYIIENGKENFGPVTGTSWRAFIHPAIFRNS